METHAAELPDDVNLLQEMVRPYQETVEQLRRRVNQLEHQLAQLLRRTYGPRRERFDPRQLSLFDTELDANETSNQKPSSENPASKNGRTDRRGHGRRRLPEDLPRNRVEYKLKPDELPCPACGHPRTKIGEEVSDNWNINPHRYLSFSMCGLSTCVDDARRTSSSRKNHHSRLQKAWPDQDS